MLPSPRSPRQIRLVWARCIPILPHIHPQVIEKDTKVRLKVVGTRVDQTEIVSAPVLHL
jgi:hypothetical protein